MSLPEHPLTRFENATTASLVETARAVEKLQQRLQDEALINALVQMGKDFKAGKLRWKAKR